MAFWQDITLGQYYPASSILHRLDPRTKLLASMILMTCLLFCTRVDVLLLLVAVGSVSILISRVPLKWFLKSLRPFVWLVIFTFAIHVFTTAGETLYRLPLVNLSITQAGLGNALIFTSRLIVMVVLAAVLMATTTPLELTDGLEVLLSPLKRLQIPVHEFVLMITLSLRFLPILLGEAQRLKWAQVSRGARLDGRLLHRVRMVVPMVVPLFVAAIRRADELSVAMQARNYVTGDNRTRYFQLQMGGSDFAALALATVSLIITLAVR